MTEEQQVVKDFDAEFDIASKVGHVFKLGGYEFHTKGYTPPSAFLDSVDRTQNVAHFIRVLLVAEDRDIFDKMMKDPDVPVDFAALGKITSWLVEQLSDRPTESPDSSGNTVGRTEDGLQEN